MKRSPIKRVGKSATSKMQKKCDRLLSPIITEMHPVCLLNGLEDNLNCAYESQVAHHHVHKSKSLALRYDLENLIPLCTHCHLMLHHNESYWASKIVEIKGLDWFREIEIKKRGTVKADIHWYNMQFETLNNK